MVLPNFKKNKVNLISLSQSVSGTLIFSMSTFLGNPLLYGER